jgi:antitoxin VapB
MPDIAKIFTTGRSQAVRLPLAYRFEGREVFIRRDPVSGDVILSQRPQGWDDFFAADTAGVVPKDFLSPADRNQGVQHRDPLGQGS